MKTVRKKRKDSGVNLATVLVKILAQDEHRDRLRRHLEDMTLSDLEQEVADGRMVARTEIMSLRPVSDSTVPRRLRELGAEVDFFELKNEVSDGGYDDLAISLRQLAELQKKTGWNDDEVIGKAYDFVRDAGLLDAFLVALAAEAREELKDDEIPAMEP